VGAKLQKNNLDFQEVDVDVHRLLDDAELDTEDVEVHEPIPDVVVDPLTSELAPEELPELIDHLSPSLDDRPATAPTLGQAALQLVEAIAGAGLASPTVELPHVAALESAFGPEALQGIQVHRGPEATASLEQLNAGAVAQGDHILLQQSDLHTVAHEVAHVVQARQGRAATDSPALEAEANRAADQAVAGGDALTALVQSPATSVGSTTAVAADTGALLAPPEDDAPAAEAGGDDTVGGGTVERPENAANPGDAPTDDPAPSDPSLPEAEGPPALPSGNPEAPPSDDPNANEQQPTPEHPADAAQQVFQAPPSRQAWQTDMLSGNMASGMSALQASWDETAPELGVQLQGQEQAPVDQLSLPELPAQDPVASMDAQLPEQEQVQVPTVSPWRAPRVSFADLGSDETSGATAEDAQEARARLSQMPTQWQGTRPSLEAPPTVVLEGGTDPGQATAAAEQAGQDLQAAQRNAQAAVVDGPGPNAIQPQIFEPVATPELAPLPEVPSLGAPAPHARFQELNLGADVEASFDSLYGGELQQAMESAQQSVLDEMSSVDTQREEHLLAADQRLAEQSDQAQQQQLEAVDAARQDIQAERQATMQAQSDLVSGAMSQVQSEHGRMGRDIDRRVRTDNQRVDERHRTANQEADRTMRDAERQAAAERSAAETRADQQDDSLWDAFVDVVSSAFEALTSILDGIFDAARSAITTVFEAARTFASEVLSAAASWIQTQIQQFGDWLKKKTEELLRERFPELADALNAAIDYAVEVA